MFLLIGLFLQTAQAQQLNVNFANLTEPGCYGLPGGSVQAIAVGGTAPYTYTWSDGTEGDLLEDVMAGTYAVTVTDAAANIASRSVTILQPELLMVDFGTQECEMPLKITALPEGGVGPYHYRWSSGDTTAMIMAVPEVKYCVTVTDANNCGAVDCISIDFNPPTVNVLVDDITCPGDNDGSITANPIGGTPPYTYAWSNGGNTATISGLAPGSYTVTLTDAKGCTDEATGNVAPKTAIEIGLGKSDPTCVGETDGSVSAVVAGGTPPYTYSWNTGATTPSITDLGPGTYSLTVTDNNGCTDENSIDLEYQSEISIGVFPTPETCPDANDGFLTVTVNNAVPPYTYSWSNGGTTQVQTDVEPGTYSVTVTDAVGCQDTASATVRAAEAIELDVTGTDVSTCDGANGSATVNVLSGTGPFTFNWSNGAATQSINNLAAGTYFVTVTGFNDCTVTGMVTIEEPPALTVDVSQNGPVCPGAADGSATATPNGGTPPYVYVWSNGANTATIDGLEPGMYSVTVTDAAGCSDTGSVLLNEAPGVNVTINGTSVVCGAGNTGTVTAIVMGASGPFSFVWNTGAMVQSLAGVGAGTYSVTVTDANGCTDEATFELRVIDDLEVDVVGVDVDCFGAANGSATANASGGDAPYTYLWNTTASTATISNLSPGTYSVTITDANGCSTSGDVQIGQPAPLNVFVNVTDPLCNGDATGIIDLSVIGGTPPFTYSWGNGADTQDLENVPAGTYLVRITDANGCFVNRSAVVEEPDVLQLDIDITNIDCADGDIGALEAIVTGGTTPYTYSWSTGAGTASIGNLGVGSYDLTVTDANGCIIEGSADITAFNTPQCEVSKLSDVVNGNDGSLEVSVSGGTAPFTYAWSNGETTEVITGLNGGLFSVTVTDANGCSTDCSFELIPLSGLGDFVWEDINRDGLQDDNEPPLIGVLVRLKNADGVIIDSTTTDMNGNYSFIGLQPGTYSVQFVGPDGFNITQLDAGDDALDSDADKEMDGMTVNVTLAPGEFNPTIDAGFYNPPSGAITDPCHCLNNATNELNGQFSEELLIRSYPGETWRIIAQENMFLLESPDPPALPIPVPLGTVMPESVIPGEYVFDFKLMDEFTYTVSATNGFDTLSFTNTCTYPVVNVGELPGPEICISDAPVPLTASPSIPGTVRFFLNDEEVTELDPSELILGDYELRVEFTPDDPDECLVTILEPISIVNTCFAKLGDYVWEDINHNGLQDETEPPIPGVVVMLTETGVDDPYTDMAVTDENGMYMFLVPPDRSYKVTFGRPEGFNPTRPDQGADDAIDSDADQMTFMTPEVYLEDGDIDLTLDAGFYFAPEAEIGDPCNCLNNSTNEENGQFSELVTIRSYPGETWTVIGTENMFLPESPAPPALPIPVPVGSIMEETEPGVYEIPFKLVDEFTYTILATNGFDTLGYTSTCTYPILNVEQLPPVEACVADAAIELKADPPTPGTVTFYLNDEPITVFDPAELPLGAYEFRAEFIPDDPKECVATILEQVGVVDDCLAKIGDFVWEDLDHDGVQDANEPGIPNVKVSFSGMRRDEPLDGMTMTDETGMYMFMVPAGTYKVTFEQPEGYVPTAQNAGADDSLDSDPDPDMLMTQMVTVEPGEMNLTLDAGFYIPATVALSDPCTCLNNATNNDNGQFSEILTIRATPGFTWRILSNQGMYLLSSPAPPATPIPVPVGTELVEIEPGVYEYPFILVDETVYSTIATNGIDTLTISNVCEYPTLTVDELPSGEVCVADDPIPLSGTGSIPGTIRFFLNGVEIDEFDPGSLELGTYELLAEFTPTDPEECIASILSQIVVGNECLAKIGDYVWHDVDQDGIQDEDEPGIEGVKVILDQVNSDNPLNAMTFTDETGMYMFQVPPGDYKVTFEQPEQYTPTVPNAGGDDALDSDMDTITLMTPVVTLVSGEMNLTLDAGFVTECINITDAGSIGYDQVLCAPGDDPEPFVNLVSANGGVGPIEYLWMYSTQPGPFNLEGWVPIPNSNSPTYDAGPLFETTYFARCARREGCPDFKETTIVAVEVGDGDKYQLDGTRTFCAGDVEAYQIIGVGPHAIVEWNFGQGAQPSKATGPIAYVRYTTPGTYTIRVNIVEDGCFAFLKQEIKVTENPVICGDGLIINAEITNEAMREVTIKWEMAYGTQYHFTVEHSADGQKFEPVGAQFDPSETTSTAMYYNFRTIAPKQGRNYYRVKMRDALDNSWYSNTEELIFFNDSKLAMLYPNPAQDVAILEVFESFGEDVTVELVTAEGRKVKSWQAPSDGKRFDLDLNDVDKGVYFLRVRFGEANVKALKLVKY
ncbi:MAG: SdrD B-like domain-containing protein [Saprospiraceae bacterium]